MVNLIEDIVGQLAHIVAIIGEAIIDEICQPAVIACCRILPLLCIRGRFDDSKWTANNIQAFLFGMNMDTISFFKCYLFS